MREEECNIIYHMNKKSIKVKILTLRSFKNYGNRLQNYALSTALRKLGCSVRTVNSRSAKEFIYNFVILRFLFRPNRVKEHQLYLFSKKITRNDYPPYKKADFTVVGSDQVWNPDYLRDQPLFLDDGQGIKISYAASVGTDKLSKKEKERFAKALKTFSLISVREPSAKKLLQPLTDKPVKVVLDPTLLLGAKDYRNLEKRPDSIAPGEKYVLCYILGNNDNEKKIKEYADSHEYKIVHLSDGRESNYGVQEFLYLIDHAKAVFTDSFHACVFSFIFDKPFIVFKRSGEANYMYSRIDNLINSFGLEAREYNGAITDKYLKVDYSMAKKKLIKYQDESIQFLKKALASEE